MSHCQAQGGWEQATLWAAAPCSFVRQRPRFFLLGLRLFRQTYIIQMVVYG